MQFIFNDTDNPRIDSKFDKEYPEKYSEITKFA